MKLFLLVLLFGLQAFAHNAPVYLGGSSGAINFVTASDSTTSTVWMVKATGGGAGAKKLKGGGGAGGSVVVALTGISASTTLNFINGAGGNGADTGTPQDGGDTTLYIGGQWQFTAMKGITPGNSTGGGPGGDPSFNGSSSYIITGTAHMIAGGDGDSWNGISGAGGASYWGGTNFGGSGGGDGAGGGSTSLAGWNGNVGAIEITRVSN